VNPCNVGNPCNGGGCTGTSGTAVCTSCTTGYVLISSNCQVDPCTSAPCQNGGACLGTSGSPVCTCASGYTGSSCGSCAAGYVSVGGSCQVNPCTSSPCQNAGACLGTSGTAYCTCINGFSGPACATAPTTTTVAPTTAPTLYPGCVGYRGSTVLATSWSFQTYSSPVKVTGFGAFDNGSGFTGNKVIYLLQGSTQVATATVTPTSPLQNSYRWFMLTTPVTLSTPNVRYSVFSASWTTFAAASSSTLTPDCVTPGTLAEYIGVAATGNVMYTTAMMIVP